MATLKSQQDLDIINEENTKINFLEHNYGVKGNPLSSSREGNNPADPVGYCLRLPKEIKNAEAIIINAYGGFDKDSKPLSLANPAIESHIDTYLLSKNIGIMTLNTVDLKYNETYQGWMLEDIFMRILNNIKSAYEHLANKDKRAAIHEKLNQLPINLKLYFYGASFGGAIGLRFAQIYPKTFDGYICHDAGLARDFYQDHVRPSLHVEKLQDNVLILQNYTDHNTHLNEQIDFYNALKQKGKTPLVQLHIFPEANLSDTQEHNIGHFLSNEQWYLQEYTQTILDFIQRTKDGQTIFTSPLPGSVQEMRKFFHKTAYQEYVEDSSPFDRWVSTGFKIYKNALQWRDKNLRDTKLDRGPFILKWYLIYLKENNIQPKSDEEYALFLKKALDILSDDQEKANASWNSIYVNIIQAILWTVFGNLK